MREIVVFLFTVMLLVFALATGAFVLIGLLILAAGVWAYLFIRQKLTGRAPGIFRVYRYHASRTAAANEPIENAPTVIEAEYEEISNDKR